MRLQRHSHNCQPPFQGKWYSLIAGVASFFWLFIFCGWDDFWSAVSHCRRWIQSRGGGLSQGWKSMSECVCNVCRAAAKDRLNYLYFWLLFLWLSRKFLFYLNFLVFDKQNICIILEPMKPILIYLVNKNVITTYANIWSLIHLWRKKPLSDKALDFCFDCFSHTLWIISTCLQCYVIAAPCIFKHADLSSR